MRWLLLLLLASCSVDGDDEHQVEPEQLHCRGQFFCAPGGCLCSGVQVTGPDAGADGGG